VKYTNATPHVSLDGIRAAPSQIKFILTREAPKRSAPSSLEIEAKGPRMTVTMLKIWSNLSSKHLHLLLVPFVL
jgi:hypothetical protein